MSSRGNTCVWDVRNDYSGVNVTTATWVQLIASLTNDCRELEIFDSSGNTMELGYGPSGSEKHLCYVPKGGSNFRTKQILNKGMRLVVRAVDANSTTGELIINAFY